MECFSELTIHERLSTYSATILGLLVARPLHQLPDAARSECQPALQVSPEMALEDRTPARQAF